MGVPDTYTGRPELELVSDHIPLKWEWRHMPWFEKTQGPGGGSKTKPESIQVVTLVVRVPHPAGVMLRIIKKRENMLVYNSHCSKGSLCFNMQAYNNHCSKGSRCLNMLAYNSHCSKCSHCLNMLAYNIYCSRGSLYLDMLADHLLVIM